MWKVVACTLGVLAGLAALAGGALVYGGLHDVAATTQHFQPVYSLRGRLAFDQYASTTC